MRGKHVKIELSTQTRGELKKFSRSGKHGVRLVNRARIILELDEADGRKPLTQARIAEKIGVSRQTVNPDFDTCKDFIMPAYRINSFNLTELEKWWSTPPP
jgi:transcriptional antiterminator